MSKIQKLLERMRNNPQDWTLDDLERICHHFAVDIRTGKGSHVYLTFPSKVTLSVPAKNPIKAVYVIQFLALLEPVKE